VAETYAEAFHEDMRALNVLPPDVEPKATEHIEKMLELIRSLIEKGNAYEIDGDVFFAVESFAEYGKLSRRDLSEMRAGERVDVDERKRHPMDFALWKSAKPGEPAWESPWGSGRPGWHIECSAMSLQYLSMGFDIHGGGRDLVFPHHENEIAQSEGATGASPFVRYWLHNGFVNIDQEKMSKSLGNIVLIRDILKHYSGDTVRLLTLTTHYRNPIDFGTEALEEAKRAQERLRECLFNLRDFVSRRDGRTPSPVRTQKEVQLTDELFDAQRRFEEAMDDDFNTARAMAVLFELTKGLNSYLAEQESYETPAAVAVVQQGHDTMLRLLQVLGLFSTSEPEECVPVSELEGEERMPASDRLPSPESLIELLLEVRDAARARKDFETSDRIRSRLQELGVRIDDRRDGTRWRRA
jgi:cysteinyl-tRNA synthetase